MEELPFLSHPEARLTTTFERTIVDLRPDMTISAISRHYHVPWHTIKTIEKRYLKHKYRKISLKNMRVIGIDEISIGHIAGRKPAYWTIVRDLESGAVLHVDKGKDGDSLQDFLKKSRRSKAKIELVAMDMGRASIAVIGKTVKAYPPRSGTWESLGYGKNKTAGGHNHHPKIARMSQPVHPSSSILLGESDGVGKSMSYALSYQSSETSCQLYPYHDRVTNLLWVDGHTSGVQGYTKDLIYGRLDGYHGYQAVPLNSKWRIFPFQ